MVIGIDFDGVMNNMLETWVSWLNGRHGTEVKVTDIKQWELKGAFPTLTEDQLFAPLHSAEFWDQVPVMHEAPEVVDKLLLDGHKIYVVTTTHFDTLSPKLTKCLFKYFPHLTKRDVIVTYDKSLIRVDVLLDDAEHNLANFPGIRVLFDAGYNKNATAMDYRVASWKEFYILVTQLDTRGLRPPFTRVHQFKAGRGMGKTAWLQEQIYNTDAPCYVIMPEQRYKHFCESYMERYHRVCPAKLYTFNERSSPASSTRFFTDMPSTFPAKSETFEYFKNIFISREYVLYVADFENTYWHTV